MKGPNAEEALVKAYKEWKEAVSNLCWSFDCKENKLKSIFEIIELEKKKDLLATGKKFQDQIESVTGHVEAQMKGYLSNYKIEYKTPLNTEFLQIYNPKMDLAPRGELTFY